MRIECDKCSEIIDVLTATVVAPFVCEDCHDADCSAVGYPQKDKTVYEQSYEGEPLPPHCGETVGLYGFSSSPEVQNALLELLSNHTVQDRLRDEGYYINVKKVVEDFQPLRDKCKLMLVNEALNAENDALCEENNALVDRDRDELRSRDRWTELTKKVVEDFQPLRDKCNGNQGNQGDGEETNAGDGCESGFDGSSEIIADLQEQLAEAIEARDRAVATRDIAAGINRETLAISDRVNTESAELMLVNEALNAENEALNAERRSLCEENDALCEENNALVDLIVWEKGKAEYFRLQHIADGHRKHAEPRSWWTRFVDVLVDVIVWTGN